MQKPVRSDQHLAQQERSLAGPDAVGERGRAMSIHPTRRPRRAGLQLGARVVLEHSGLTLEEYGAAMQIGMDITYSLTARTRLVHTQCLGAIPGQMLRAIWHALNTK